MTWAPDVAPQVFVSTGAAREESAASWAAALLGAEVLPIEMSGGAFSPRARDEVRDLSSQTPVMLHNYFPPPADPFVLNLASEDPETAARSRQMVTDALDLSAEIGASHYAVHSGYCFDPSVTSLGRPLVGSARFDREAAFGRLLANVTELARYATERGVRLMIENHVLAKFNLENSGDNPLLLAEPREILEFFDAMDVDLSLLLDVGHLKVSAMTLGFDLDQGMRALLPLAEGFHLSENSGMTDDHKSFDESVWFLPYLKGRDDFMTVEIHSADPQDSVSAARATKNYLAEG